MESGHLQMLKILPVKILFFSYGVNQTAIKLRGIWPPTVVGYITGVKILVPFYGVNNTATKLRGIWPPPGVEDIAS